MKKYLILCNLLLLVTLVGCGQTKKTAKTFNITTSFYPMYYFAKEIVKDKAEVTMITPTNTEPHDYEPSAKAIAKIENSSLFIYNSEAMETWVNSIKKTVTNDSTVTFVKASQGIPLEEEAHSESEKHHDHQHELDPHVWLDPMLAKKEVQTMTKAIIQKDEKNKSYYEKNSQKLQERLDQLNQKFQRKAKQAKNKTFVTQHAAFGYLAKQYGLHQEAIAGIDPEQEPSPKELANIEKLVKKEKIRYIYTEETSSSKVAQTVKNATGATLLTLNTLESVSKQEQKQGKNYFTIMEDNLNQLEKTFQS